MTHSHLLLKIAREAIKEELIGKKLIDRDALLSAYPELAQQQAVFVTIYKKTNGKKQLRGCIGSIVPVRSLIDDLIINAKAAAFQDPRFSPLRIEEWDDVSLEISLLSIPEVVTYKDKEELKRKIIPFQHGVILSLSGRKATFLPQVWEKIPDFDLFFNQLCLKAGLPENCLDFHPEIRVYSVEEIKET